MQFLSLPNTRERNTDLVNRLQQLGVVQREIGRLWQLNLRLSRTLASWTFRAVVAITQTDTGRALLHFCRGHDTRLSC
jgi:hypothetical protein